MPHVHPHSPRNRASCLAWPWLLTTLFLAGLAGSAFAQTTTMTLRPGPGLNNGSDEGSAAAGKDTYYLRSGDQSDDGTSSNVQHGTVGVMAIWNSNCNVFQARAYMRFDLSELPPADRVTRAELLLYQRFGGAYGYQLANTTMTVNAVTEPWDEMTMTFFHRPTVSPVVSASVTLPSTGYHPAFEGFVTLDITGLYRQWADGTLPNYGLEYGRPQAFCENGNYNYVTSSDSLEEAKRPALRVTYLDTVDTVAPVIAPSPSLQAEATSALGAVVSYVTPTATDDKDGPVPVTCQPASGSRFPLGTTTVGCTASDAAGNLARSFFTVSVGVTTDGLCRLIDSFVSNKGLANSLKVKLRNGALGAFGNEVRAQTGKALTADQAATLLTLSAYL